MHTSKLAQVFGVAPSANKSLLCRDSDTLREPKKSSSTCQVTLKYFNRIFFWVHNIRCRSYHNLVYDRTVVSNRQVLTIWYELVIYILNLGIWNFVYMFGMNPPDVLVGYVHRRRKSDLGRLYISRASTHASLRIFFNNKGMFIWNIIRLCVVGVWHNKRKYIKSKFDVYLRHLLIGR